MNALYANLHWEDTMTSYGGKVITYDTIGNVTSYDGWKYTWENRQLRECKNDSTKVTYYYDFNGLRSQKTVYDLTKTNAGESYSYIWKDDKISHVEYSSWDYEKGTSRSRNEVKIVYDGENPVGMIVVSGSSNLPLTSEYLFTTNMQGDITGIVDENGNTLVSYSYDPWGNVTYTLNTDSTIADLVRKLNPFTYRGYNYDYETGLYYLQSRYYNPQWGRFMSSDIYLETGTGVLGSNVFAYCDNDPVNNEDPTGHWGEDVHNGYYSFDFLAKKINGKKYGTYYWAREAGFPKKNAKILAYYCFDVDNKYPAWYPTKSNQSWHFNVNKGTSRSDSRLEHLAFCALVAIGYFEIATENYINGEFLEATANITRALKSLGYALHPAQDISAHTDEIVKLKTNIVFSYYSHVGIDDVDNAEKHSDIILNELGPAVIDVLKIFVNEYHIIKEINGVEFDDQYIIM